MAGKRPSRGLNEQDETNAGRTADNHQCEYLGGPQGAGLAHDPAGGALSVARGRTRHQGARRHLDGVPLDRQADLGRDPDALQGGGGPVVGRRGRIAGLDAGARRHRADRCLRRCPVHGSRLSAIARCHLRAGRTARAAGIGARDLRPYPRAQHALSHHAQDRRAQPDHGARRQGRRVPAALSAVQHRAPDHRTGDGRGGVLLSVRRLVSGRRGGDHRALCPFHLQGDRMAGEDPQADERPGHRRQPEGGRQPPEFRDGEVFQRRKARSPAL